MTKDHAQTLKNYLRCPTCKHGHLDPKTGKCWYGGHYPYGENFSKTEGAKSDHEPKR